MSEKSCRKCGAIGVWGSGKSVAEGGAKMCVEGGEKCVCGRKMCVEGAKNGCGRKMCAVGGGVWRRRKIIFFYCYGVVL